MGAVRDSLNIGGVGDSQRNLFPRVGDYRQEPPFFLGLHNFATYPPFGNRRRLFPRLTVEENLLLGAYRRSARAAIAKNLEFCFATFPRLAERRRQLAGSMSGGEQQMLTLARALMTAPKILLIDEPSVGLAPILVIHTIDKIRELKEGYGLTVLMAEQNFNQAIRIADRGYVIVRGRIEYEGASREDLANNELIHKLYMGL